MKITVLSKGTKAFISPLLMLCTHDDIYTPAYTLQQDLGYAVSSIYFRKDY
jgi:hypothetical protein